MGYNCRIRCNAALSSSLFPRLWVVQVDLFRYAHPQNFHYITHLVSLLCYLLTWSVPEEADREIDCCGYCRIEKAVLYTSLFGQVCLDECRLNKMDVGEGQKVVSSFMNFVLFFLDPGERGGGGGVLDNPG